MLLPFLLFPLLLKFVTKTTLFSFNDYDFSVFVSNSQKEKKLELDDIKSYTVEFPNDRFCEIKFNFNYEKNIEYSFNQKKKHKEDIESSELIDYFHLFIKNCNSTKSDFEKILFKPPFYATNWGLVVIISLIAFLGLGIALYIIYDKKELPLTFLLSFILIMRVVSKRKSDLRYFREIEDKYFR